MPKLYKRVPATLCRSLYQSQHDNFKCVHDRQTNARRRRCSLIGHLSWIASHASNNARKKCTGMNVPYLKKPSYRRDDTMSKAKRYMSQRGGGDRERLP